MYKTKQSVAAFSLIEMMAVIACIAILLGIAGPALNNIGRSGALKKASKTVGGEIAVARSIAVARRRYVGVLMPGPNAASLKEADRYTCMRRAYLTRTASGYEFDKWVADSRWLFVPTGCSILEADGDIGVNQEGTTGVFTKQPGDNSYSKVDNVDLSDTLGGDSDVDSVRAVVFSPSGRLRGDSRYVTLGEATLTGGFWQLRSVANEATNQSVSNQVTLEVNRFSGSVSYRNPENY